MSNTLVSTDQSSADPQVKIDVTNNCFRPFITLLRANVTELLKKIPAAGTRAVIGLAGNVSGEELWKMYLDSAPDAAERQGRNCSCCRDFFRNYAHLIQLTADGLSHSLLFQDHEDFGAHYRPFVQAAQEKLRNARVEKIVFADYDRAAVSIGVDVAGGFNHMHFHLENVLVRPNKAKTSNQNAADLREEVRILTGSFGNWSDPIIKRGIELFANHERLSRSTHAGVIAEYADIREKYKSIKHSNVRHNYAVIAALTSRPAVVRLGASSSVTGEFLTQSEKVNENFALQRFLSQTSAEVYMRPVAAPTSGAVAAAEKLFAELELAPSLKRRPLRRDELTDLLWAKPVKTEEATAGVFGGIKTKDAAAATKDLPVIKGSALQALNVLIADPKTVRGGNKWVDGIWELLDAVDTYIPTPERDTDKAFLMPVEDVFTITGRGTVATGRVERGIVKVQDEVEIVGLRDTRKTTVTGIEMHRKLLDSGMAGDNVGVLLRGVARDDVERGQVLAKPGSIKPHTKFEASVYILSKEEGGRHSAFFAGYRPQFYFRTTDVTGVVELPEGVEMVMPGDNITFVVELIKPVAMEEGLRFAIREGGRTVGAGVVAKVTV